ncbi:LysR family transcriptional regulator [Bacillus suaedae]|uniref:LysR family transcriptional regulator n=1 Tax=Halalkalibacter suaedae TaxID=2822140 RepID=A0A941AMU0_9BACI|nr:LysR family transcriptional regulator [Bacillus suaedae]MBP3950905.1 LysR family transcriptional regulator [Bacillus suaedae]
MELRQLTYFIEVAKREHMTEAAEALHVAQSAVSRQISNLEGELGVDLFIRHGRRVRLTPIGKLFLEHITEAMKMIQNATQQVNEHLDPERGTVRIAFPISMAAYTLPKAISAFRLLYPQAKFQLKQGTYYNLIDHVIDGNYNMALLGPVPMNEDYVTGHILFSEKLIALLPIDHPLANEPVLKIQQLRDDPFILLPKGMYFRDMVINACLEEGFMPNVSFEGDDVDALKGLVSAGLGITLIPEMTVIENIPRSTVKVPIADPEVTRTVGIITPSDRKLLPTEKLFFDFLVEFYKGKFY